MPSRRKIKKHIKNITNVLIEDAFIESINGDEKEMNKMDAIIDSVIDDRHDLINKVSAYPQNGKRSEIKAHFNDIKTTLEAKATEYGKQIGRVR